MESTFGPKEKPLYVKNMEYLLKKAREKSKLKTFFNLQIDLQKKLSVYNIPEDKYYFSKMLKSLLKRNKETVQNRNFLEHFSLTCQSCLYIRGFNIPPIEEIEEKKIKMKNKSNYFF